jgi:predicted metal-dependent enzyme (double-stranded beta helix superfamily)
MTITATNRLHAFEHLIQQLRKIWASVSDIETRMKRAETLLKVMLADPRIIAHSKQWPWTPGQNLLLYEDPDHHFVINASVRKPGSKGSVHDHGHSWTLYGLVEGTERIDDTPGWMTARAPAVPSSSSSLTGDGPGASTSFRPRGAR